MYYIGVDLGGTNIAAGIVDEDGRIIRKKSVPTNRERSSEEIVNDISKLIVDIMNEEGLTPQNLHSIGIGSPGIHDRENGVIIYNNNLNFKNVPVREEIQKKVPVPVYLENDANCAAIAESVAGAAKGEDFAIIITIGTGIGGAIISDRKLYIGFNGAGGELGHMVIQANGESCTCGRKGCWEAYSSATALIDQTKAAAEKNPGSKIYELVNGDLTKINAKTAFDAAKMGDKTGIEVVDNYITYFAEGLANIVNIFQPGVIVIGGGVSKEGEYLLKPLREKIRNITYSSHGLEEGKIVTAKMGNDAGIVGAAFISKA
ncbi:MAG: ROK family protein [Clostridiaceae bacterium]|nr:ROK family protein [Clostridiaceae bacterium]